jgi:light-regulated signal transduction histidine kinase (bacteriophytochrome)
LRADEFHSGATFFAEFHSLPVIKMASLAYSRVTTKGEAFTEVDLSISARKAGQILDLIVEESGARVELGDFPTIETDTIQMLQLFQNEVDPIVKTTKGKR